MCDYLVFCCCCCNFWNRLCVRNQTEIIIALKFYCFLFFFFLFSFASSASVFICFSVCHIRFSWCVAYKRTINFVNWNNDSMFKWSRKLYKNSFVFLFMHKSSSIDRLFPFQNQHASNFSSWKLKHISSWLCQLSVCTIQCVYHTIYMLNLTFNILHFDVMLCYIMCSDFLLLLMFVEKGRVERVLHRSALFGPQWNPSADTLYDRSFWRFDNESVSLY